jgi:hypothetical protein
MIGLWLVETQSLAFDSKVNGFSPGERAEISDEPVSFFIYFNFYNSHLQD